MATQSKVNLISDIINRMNANINLLNIVDEDKTSDDIAADNIRSFKYYRINTVGTTDFTLVGSADNVVGTVFLSINVRSGNPVADTTGIINEVEPTYGTSPFIANVFKYFDNGMIRELLDLENTPIEEIPDPRRYIIVEVTSAELEKENIYNVDVSQSGEDETIAVPLESWLGSVGIELLIWCENSMIYNQVYDAILTMHEDQFVNIVETNTNIINDGTTRSLELTSPIIRDGDQLININGDNYKEIFFPINVNITNKGILRASRRRIQYRTSADGVSPEVWEEVPLSVSAKDFKYNKLHQDDTNSGESVRKSIVDIADREIAFNVVYDYDKQFIKDLDTEIEKTRFNDDEFIYNLKLIKELPDGTRNEFEMKTSLASLIENNNSNYTLYLLSFLEVE